MTFRFVISPAARSAVPRCRAGRDSGAADTALRSGADALREFRGHLPLEEIHS